MTTRVRVAVRSRPLVEKETSDGCETCVTPIDETQVLLGKVCTLNLSISSSKLSHCSF